MSFVNRISEPETHLLGWNVPPDELASIPEHWLSHMEPNASLHYLLGTVYIAFMFVALIGNGLVLWVFTSYVLTISKIAFPKLNGLKRKEKNVIFQFTVQNRYELRQMYL